MTMLTRAVTLLAGVLLAASSGSAAIFNETVNGDLSGDRAAPTMFSLTVGSNDLFATTAGGDLDVVTVDVPAGHRLSRLLMRSFTSAGFDQRAFLGLQSSATFTVDPNTAGAASLLGFTHFGTIDFSVGADMLPEILSGSGTIGDVQNILPPLPAGPYSVFLQQFGTANTYQLDFVVEPIPEPATIALCGVGFALIVAFARRKAGLTRS